MTIISSRVADPQNNPMDRPPADGGGWRPVTASDAAGKPRAAWARGTTEVVFVAPPPPEKAAPR